MRTKMQCCEVFLEMKRAYSCGKNSEAVVWVVQSFEEFVNDLVEEIGLEVLSADLVQKVGNKEESMFSLIFYSLVQKQKRT